MFSIPGFDTKTFSNDELFDKQLELTRRSLLAARFGKMDMVNQLQTMIQAIEIERQERMFVERIGNYMLASSPIAIETDCDLREQELVAEDTKQAAKTASEPTRPTRRPIRSTRPIKPLDDGPIK